MLLAPRPDDNRNGDFQPASAPPARQEVEGVRLAESASQALRRTGYSGLRNVGVAVRDGVIVLEGHVASYYLKQLAQEAVRPSVSGAVIRNELDVAAGSAAD